MLTWTSQRISGLWPLTMRAATVTGGVGSSERWTSSSPISILPPKKGTKVVHIIRIELRCPSCEAGIILTGSKSYDSDDIIVPLIRYSDQVPG